MLTVYSNIAHVLIDSGATHSFVSCKFAAYMNKELESLSEALLVCTPTGENIVIERAYFECEIVIDGEVWLVDLLPLELLEFDVILGMDFLSKYHAKVDCFKKEVWLSKPDGIEVVFKGRRRILPTCVISAVKAKKLLSKGYEAYLAHVMEVKAEKLKPEDVPIVQEFLDVFPEELSGLPPDREVEFTIDLVLGTTPISQAPYRMVPSELKELKVQLQELVDKGYIRPSVS